MRVWLSEAPGPRVVSLTTRERNLRVARRCEHDVISTLDGLDDDAALLYVPENLLIEKALFTQIRASGDLVRLRAPGVEAELLLGPAEEIRRALAEGADSAPVRQLPEDCVRDVSTPAAREASALAILRATEKPTDGIVSRNLNRPMSRWFSHRFMKLGLKPIHATVINGLVGIGAGVALAQPEWYFLVLAGFLFQWTSMFDGVDGEMARATLAESQLGAALDSLTDNATYLLCLIGFVIGWWRAGMGPADYTLAAVAVVSIPLTLLQVLGFIRRYAPDSSFVFFDTCVRRAAADGDNSTLRAISVLFYALRRDVLAMVMFVASLFGSRALIIALVIAGMLLANYTMLAHKRRLADAARALNPALGAAA